MEITMKSTATIKRRQLLKLAGISSLYPSHAWAAFPDRPIKLIVPWATGGSTDAIARALAQRMSESLKQSVVVDNRAGAAGQIGTDAAAKSAPDGYTLTILELPHAIAPAVVAKLPYDILKDFAPISLIGTAPLVLFAASNSVDFKAFLRSGSATKPLSLGHSGTGSVSHLAAEMLGRSSKTKLTLVPYRGSAPALADVAGGQVDGHFATLASASGLLSTGKLKPLAVASAARVNTPQLSQVPTLKELGFKDFEVNQWWALVAPATTAIATLELYRAELAAAIADSKVTDRLSSLGVALTASTRDQTRAFMRSESARWQSVAKEAGLQPL
jgi:tripartite-type tricarboxylate transporter receptor subunit TctC